MGKPTAKILSCGAERVITPKDRLTINKETIAGNAIITAVFNIVPVHVTTSHAMFLDTPLALIGKLVKLSIVHPQAPEVEEALDGLNAAGISVLVGDAVSISAQIETLDGRLVELK